MGKQISDPEVTWALAVRIRQARYDSGLTARELAALASLGVSFLSDVENGKRCLSVASLLKIARALKAKPATLLEGLEEKQ
jgi:transcriptional regulator with XRE-family HTH domain